MDRKVRLRIEKSQNNSGVIEYISRIPLLKEDHYHVQPNVLDGDAPKQFIKAYFFERDGSVRRQHPKTWKAYIAKTADKWYPHESVVEYMLNRIGQVLGVYMNDIKLVQANSKIRFLSEYFLGKDERLVHGAEICGEHLNDMIMAKQIAVDRQESRQLFTFEFIRQAINAVYPHNCHEIVLELVKMIAFDAIVGNNDRHFYNWGVIDSKKKSLKSPKFAPLYDSARGLLWNYSDDRLATLYKDYLRNNGKKVVSYVESAAPRISIEKNKEANHFELVKFLKQENSDYCRLITSLSAEENEERILTMLQKEFFHFFVSERNILIPLILKMRFQKIREV